MLKFILNHCRMKTKIITTIGAQQVSNRQVQNLVKIVLAPLYVLGLAVIMAGCSSKGESDVDPQATATNSGEYFGQCKINDLVCYDNTVNTSSFGYDSYGNPQYSIIFGMYVDKNPHQQLTVLFSLKSFPGKGKYALSASNTEIDYVVRPAGDTYASKKVSGTLEITDYQPKKLITGKFDIVSSDGTRTITLKEGEFKLKSEF